jgi:hypothetical protein
LRGGLSYGILGLPAGTYFRVFRINQRCAEYLVKTSAAKWYPGIAKLVEGCFAKISPSNNQN